LTPNQIRAAADQRFTDAQCLLNSPKARYNGAVYLCGLVLDCLLKARLLEKHSHLAAATPDRLSPRDRHLWNLVFRSHELEVLLHELPDVMVILSSREQQGSHRLRTALRSLCARWNIQLRYSPILLK